MSDGGSRAEVPTQYFDSRSYEEKTDAGAKGVHTSLRNDVPKDKILLSSDGEESATASRGADQSHTTALWGNQDLQEDVGRGIGANDPAAVATRDATVT